MKTKALIRLQDVQAVDYYRWIERQHPTFRELPMLGREIQSYLQK